MWVGPTQTAIYNNTYPIYVKAFVFLSFDTGGPSALTNNVTLNLDFDEVPPIFGCTDPTANDYDSTATIDDGSCTYPIYGCMDPNADNYDSTATVDDGSCTYPVYTLPPFTFTHTVTQDFIDLACNGTSGGTIVTLFTFSLNVQPAMNILPNSLQVFTKF